MRSPYITASHCLEALHTTRRLLSISVMITGHHPLDEARDHAQELAQQGFDGRIEKHYEWRNLVYGPKWHRDDYDPDAIEIIEDFPVIPLRQPDMLQ